MVPLNPAPITAMGEESYASAVGLLRRGFNVGEAGRSVSAR